jgi:hypothetical protein
MPDLERDDSAKKRPTPTPPAKPDRQADRKVDRRAEEGLREQSKTELDERPYLDTEGGE